MSGWKILKTGLFFPLLRVDVTGAPMIPEPSRHIFTDFDSTLEEMRKNGEISEKEYEARKKELRG